jgi:hypothetical protein
LATWRLVATGLGLSLFVALVAFAADTVPNEIKLPGTQPEDESILLGIPGPQVPLSSVGNCGCHNFNDNPVYESHPESGWRGGMMANAGRDPLFWATLAIAEQDFLPGSGGVGDLCLHCHSVGGWLDDRSTPTNGSGLDASDDEGIMCHFCHQLVDPDEAVNVSDPDYSEAQGGDFVAFDPNTGEGYYGGAEYVLNGQGERLGPYTDHVAKHTAVGTEYFRDARFCGTCHDVSNPAVGDLAHNFGSMVPLEPGTYSGSVADPNDPVADKAAFNNEPYKYGIVERTFSEWEASAFQSLEVQQFGTLPGDLQVPGGSLEIAYNRSLWGTCSGSGDYCNVDVPCPGTETCVTSSVNYQDGTIRKFTCQTCHMAAAPGQGASNAKVGGNPLIRPDLPRHDQTGGSYWIQEAIRWQDEHDTLVFGGGLSWPMAEMDAARQRAVDHLESAASLSAVQEGNFVRVRVTNLTGHKLISGYPEGRRMFLNLVWKDGGGAVIEENGAYGPIGTIVDDLNATPWDVESIIDPKSTKVYEAKPGMTRAWANQLVSLGYPTDMVLEWDHHDNSPLHTLGDLAGWPTNDGLHTFHFVLNNVIIKDNRIPPYGMAYDAALEHSCLPVPTSQYGDPGAGGVYDYWDEELFPIPAGAATVEVSLKYQSTSWEYIQFLWLQNDTQDPFLGNEGIHLLDAWLNTGMSAPHTMEAALPVGVTAPSFNPPGTASGAGSSIMNVTGYDAGTGAVSLSYTPACDATGHTVHYGGLADVSTYGWGGADCGLGTSGTGSFVPDPGVGESIFFVLVGNNDDWEGGYGVNRDGVQRPPNTAAAGSCLRTQSVRNFCE